MQQKYANYLNVNRLIRMSLHSCQAQGCLNGMSFTQYSIVCVSESLPIKRWNTKDSQREESADYENRAKSCLLNVYIAK